MPEEEIEDIVYDPEYISRRSVIWSGILFLATLLVILGLSLYVLSDDDLYYPYKLITSINMIEALHPDDIGRTDLTVSARNAIFNNLDRYSGYVERADFDRVTEEFTGSYSGIGISVVPHDDGLLIMSVREDGPAGKAGLKSGDIIIRADSIMLNEISSYQASFHLRGPEGTDVALEIVRAGVTDPLEIILTREKLKLIHVAYAGLTDNGMLYIRLLDFEAGLFEELSDILDSVYYNQIDSVRGVILDLKGNPGGLLSEVISVADLFLPEDKLIVGIQGRSYWNRREYYARDKDSFESLPLAVLTDYGSASASEILAGTLKYANRAVLIGDTTFGKGLVQQYLGFTDGSGIRLTISRYYFEGDNYINRPGDEKIDSAAGIAPDYYFETESYEPFIVTLESSGRLRTFALQNSKEIARYTPMSSESERWFEEFRQFLIDSDFSYESDLSELVRFTRDELVYGESSEATYRAVDKLLNISQRDDLSQIDKFREYIQTRLYRIAVEAEYGTSGAYRMAIVPYRKDIALAENITGKIEPLIGFRVL